MNIEKLREKPFFLDDERIAWVQKTLEDMSIEDKVGQVFCLCPASVEKNVLSALTEQKPGGFMLRPYDDEEVANAVNVINSLSKVPVFLAADLEKGGNGIANQGTIMGSPLAVAATNDEKYAEKLGVVCASEGKALGINWAFGPIVDIDINPFNPITNVRTFGSDKDRVKRMSLAYLQGAQRNGVACTCKHFPGDGVDFRDQHVAGTTNSLSVEEWNNSYGDVYKACIEAGTMSIMVGHIYLPSWAKKVNPELQDKDLLPSSMSPEIIQGLLRAELGFNGLIVTDATTMTGFIEALPRQQLIPQVIASGVDMILFSINITQDKKYLLDALERGELKEEYINDAVIRILAMKAALNLHKSIKRVRVEEARKVLGCTEHVGWAKEIADKSVTIVKKEENVLPLTNEKYHRILYIPLEGQEDKFAHNRIRTGASRILGELLQKEGFSVTVLSRECEAFQYIRVMEWVKEHYDAIIYCANYGTTSNQTVVRIQWPDNNMSWCPNFIHTIPTIFISIENPYHLIDVPRVKTYINAYSPTDDTIIAVFEKLTGKGKFEGISPVNPFCGLWDAML